MKESVTAVFEDGVFKPTKPLHLADGERVRLTVETTSPTGQYNVLQLASDVYKGLSERDIEEVEEMARRRPFFDDVRS